MGGISSEAKSGGVGTLYTKANNQGVGDLLLNNTGRTNAMETPLTTPTAYRLTLSSATACASVPLTLSGLRVGTNSALSHPFQGPRLQLSVHGNAVVEAGGAVAAEARGYPANTGPGHGNGAEGSSGAGHGGHGGAGYSAGAGGVTYDSETEPVDFGSGGGGGYALNRGGGAIQLTVEGTLTIDGRVSVNADQGNYGNCWDGGGSGGSVWLAVSRLNGAGSITANGQLATYPLSGSGGGGRISIHAGVNQFAGAVVASGGMSSRPGEAGTTYYATNFLSGLVSWWPGENSAEDIAGPNNGTTVGGAAYAPGIVGQAFDLTTDGAGFMIPHDEALNVSSNGFTVEFWMQGVKNQPQSLFLVVDKSHGWVDSTGWLFQGYSSSGQVFFGIGEGGGSIVNFPLATSTTDVLDGQWHHVAGTWDGALLRIFVDGAQQDQAALTTPFNNTRPVNLGFSWGGGTPNRFFRGKVDELALYNRALTTNEIAAIYAANAGKLLPPPTLAVTATNGGVVLSWSALYGGYALFSCPDLASSSWDTVTNPPVLNGTRKEVLLPINSPAQRFFRLKLGN